MNRRIRLASLITAMVTLSGLLASPANANEASGYLSVSSNTLDGQRGIQRFTFSMQLDDRDGISSSYVTCTNKAGFQVFSLRFARIPMEAYFTNESASPVIKLLNFRELTSATSGRYASRMIFDVPIAAIWKRNETCTAATYVEDRFGNVKLVDTDTLTLVNNLVAASPAPSVPSPQPTPSSTPTLVSTMCQPPQDMIIGASDPWTAVYSTETLTVTLPEEQAQPLCEIGYKLLINSGGANFQSIDLNVPLTKRTIKIIKRDSLELVLERTFYHSQGPLAYMTINGQQVRGVAKQFRSPKYLVLVNNQETLDTKEELSAALAQNSKQVSTRLANFKYTYCYEINEFIPDGIASKKNSKHKKAFVSSKGYALNKNLDKDKDGVVCEK